MSSIYHNSYYYESHIIYRIAIAIHMRLKSKMLNIEELYNKNIS